MQRCIPRNCPLQRRKTIGSMDLRSNVLHWPTMELKKCSRGSLVQNRTELGMECLEFIKESLHITNGEIKRRDGALLALRATCW